MRQLPVTTPSRAGAAHGARVVQAGDSGVEVFIGGQPRGYEALQQMGFRSVIDVDATPPGVRLPEAMTIVHLPLRYSGITHEQASELIAALEELERPVYIHCHHGTNRAPAAAAVGLIGTGEWSSAQGMQLMDQAGADSAFHGLFRSVADARVIPAHERAPRVSNIQSFDSFAVLMAKIDEQMSLLAMATSGVSPSPEAAAESAALVDLLRVAFDGCAQMEEEAFAIMPWSLLRRLLRLSMRCVANSLTRPRIICGLECNMLRLSPSVSGLSSSACGRKVIVGKFKPLELKCRTHGAADKCPVAQRTCRLPRVGGNNGLW